MKEGEEVDVWKEKVQQDLNELKTNQSQMKNEQENLKSDIHDLKMSDQLQNQEISNLKGVLEGIQDDTRWIRRKITGAFITAVITALVAGIIGVAITNIYG